MYLALDLAQPQSTYSMTSDSIPTIKKRSRPQPRVRETSLEGENDTQKGDEDEEQQGLPCVNAYFFSSSTN